ncbi:hypothetical protein GCM10009785_09340 [Brooklawnia cerclae]|uniref:Nuclease of restriction endonuclease-like (RecB) superfamily n=1 Tax=Brooklawnia cerclae TaxID=349934 RepID=A0ABX0SJP0_9ACTN|nr:Nif11-like leader peptide family natural product precursor [Brooklawnia cerclae]NIH58139.1 putative nuclease of restriction endonuclease-like (RecB) superfamily [Brooklawnia cerclae]
MSKAEVERLLTAGGSDKTIRLKYDFIDGMEDFTAAAAEDGYEFSVPELKQVLAESGDSFEVMGNPRRREIWWF